MKKVAVIGNGDINVAKNTLETEHEYIIAADGGANYCVEKNITPDIIIGDGDSITSQTKAYFSDVPQQYSSDQHTTDLAKALHHAHTIDESVQITLFGFTSSIRLDHTQAAVQALITDPAIHSIVTPSQTIYVVHSDITIQHSGTRQATVSIVPVENTATVIITGMKWSGSNICINSSGSGMSNTIINQSATITVSTGSVLVYVMYE